MFTNNVVMEDVNTDISTVLKMRPNYSTSEWNRKRPISLPSLTLLCAVQNQDKTTSKGKDEKME